MPNSPIIVSCMSGPDFGICKDSHKTSSNADVFSVSDYPECAFSAVGRAFLQIIVSFDDKTFIFSHLCIGH